MTSVFYKTLGETEVDEEEGVWVTDGADYDVLWFDVAVDYAPVVALLQS